MAKPPMHMVCGTAHWSTEGCPARKGAVPKRPEPVVAPAPRRPKKSNVAVATPAEVAGAALAALANPVPDLDAEGWKVRALNAEAELERIAARERSRVERHRLKQKGGEA